jgi:hypothetical protein
LNVNAKSDQIQSPFGAALEDCGWHIGGDFRGAQLIQALVQSDFDAAKLAVGKLFDRFRQGSVWKAFSGGGDDHEMSSLNKRSPGANSVWIWLVA